MQTIRIDPEFQSLIPPLALEELSQLAANILADGCREPLVIWKGHDIILDGHNRYRIVQEHGLPFSTVDVDLPDRESVKIWIIKNQFGRRNLTNFQRIELVAILKPLIAEQAKERQGKRMDLNIISEMRESSPVKTDEELAKLSGVSSGVLYGGMRIIKKGVPELQDLARDKKVSIENAAEIASLPQKEQAEVIKKGPEAVATRAKEIIATRKAARHAVPESIRVPKDTKGNPMPQATEAMQFAVIAISQLERVRANDPRREEALNRVKNWIDKKLQEWKGNKS
jgi:ParB-like chromosome segregation protein Spo0J